MTDVPESPRRTKIGQPSAARIFICIGLFLLTLAPRLYAMSILRIRAPLGDQWHAIIDSLLKPLAHGSLSMGDIWEQNLEHRLFTTKLISVGLVRINGSFDNTLEYLCMAVLAACCAVSAFLICSDPERPETNGPAALVVGATYLGYGAFENIFNPFNGQYYIYLASMFGAIWLALSDKPTILKSLGSVALCWLATVTLSSGLFLAFVLGIFVAIRSKASLPHRIA